MLWNRNKRSIVLDLKEPAGLERLKSLAAVADVMIENFKPGTAERIGVGYRAMAALNPRLIYCSISGFGQTGPYAGLVVDAQALHDSGAEPLDDDVCLFDHPQERFLRLRVLQVEADRALVAPQRVVRRPGRLLLG